MAARRGEYNTQRKERIVAYLASLGDRHVTAESLVEGLRAEGVTVGRTTAYRHLEQLTRQGVVRRFFTDAGESACYQYIDEKEALCPAQMHCRCTECGALFHVSCGLVEELNEHFRDEHSFMLDASRTILYGKCAKCAEEDEHGASDAKERHDGI